MACQAILRTRQPDGPAPGWLGRVDRDGASGIASGEVRGTATLHGVPWWGVASAVVAPALLVSGWTFAAGLQRGTYNAVADTVSTSLPKPTGTVTENDPSAAATEVPVTDGVPVVVSRDSTTTFAPGTVVPVTAVVVVVTAVPGAGAVSVTLIAPGGACVTYRLVVASGVSSV